MDFQQTARVYRFRKAVAMITDADTLDSCPTIYLSADMARKLGEALIACADDIEKVEFVKSNFETVEIIG